MSKTLILVVLAIAMCNFSNAQNPLLDKKNYRSAQIKVMKVEYFQTAEYLQNEKGLYINDFQILDIYTLDKKEKRKLKKNLSKKDIFLESTNRPCPFIANYAIEIKSKNVILELILTGKQCPKMMVKNVYTEEVLYYDLVGDCQIFELFDDYFK